MNKYKNRLSNFIIIIVGVITKLIYTQNKNSINKSSINREQFVYKSGIVGDTSLLRSLRRQNTLGHRMGCTERDQNKSEL